MHGCMSVHKYTCMRLEACAHAFHIYTCAWRRQRKERDGGADLYMVHALVHRHIRETETERDRDTQMQ
jgi:hypothetical protein